MENIKLDRSGNLKHEKLQDCDCDCGCTGMEEVFKGIIQLLEHDKKGCLYIYDTHEKHFSIILKMIKYTVAQHTLRRSKKGNDKGLSPFNILSSTGGNFVV